MLDITFYNTTIQSHLQVYKDNILFLSVKLNITKLSLSAFDLGFGFFDASVEGFVELGLGFGEFVASDRYATLLLEDGDGG